MGIVNGSLQEGYKDAAWFAANPTLVLLVGQKVNLEQTGTYKLGDGTSQLSALSFLGGSGSGLSGLTTNKVLKATSATTAGDSNITDDGTTVSINTKTSITQNTTGTGSKGLSVNFNTIGEVFYIDDNGELIYNANAGATFKGSNGIINVISNGGVNPYIIFKYANGANTSGYLSGDGNSLVIDTAALKVNHLTASELTATDSSKNLVSLPVATYPSLTELSYGKGVTSAIQTQLNSKASNFINKKNSDTPHTGTTSPTVIHSFEITPGTCQANDVLKFYIRHLSTNNANSKTVKMWANTSNTISGATQLSNYAYTTNSGGVFPFKRSMIFKNSLSSQKMINVTISHANDEVSYPNNGDVSLALDFTASVWILIEVTLANAADIFTMNLFNCKIER